MAIRGIAGKIMLSVMIFALGIVVIAAVMYIVDSPAWTALVGGVTYGLLRFLGDSIDDDPGSHHAPSLIAGSIMSMALGMFVGAAAAYFTQTFISDGWREILVVTLAAYGVTFVVASSIYGAARRKIGESERGGPGGGS